MPDYPQTTPAKSKPRKLGVFERALIRELVNNGMLLFSVLLGIVVISQLIRFLSDAVSGKLAADGVLALLGFSALNYLPVLLSLSVFMAILMTLSRSYRDSEMVVWHGAGLALTAWIRPVLLFALPVIAVIALLSLVLSPWALQKSDQFKQFLENRDDVTATTPGMFRESKQADRVYFVENTQAGNNRVNNIFVQSVQNGRVGTMFAKQGIQETRANGDRFLILFNGTRYEGTPGQRDYRIVTFERYAMRIEAAPPKPAQAYPRNLPTWVLLKKPTTWNLAELEWRLGLPISALLLALLAIPLGYINPRAGRSLNFVTAMVIYMLYSNIISVSNAWVGHGRVAAGWGMLVVHGLMLALIALWFQRRMTLFSWRRMLVR